MARLFYHVMQDNLGNLLFDVSGTMRIAGSGTLATIYGDEALTVILPNPMTNHPSFGSFKCFLGAGDYDFYMAKSGYTFETLTGVQGHGTMAQQDASAVAITGGTVQAAIISATGQSVGGPRPVQFQSIGAGGASVMEGWLSVGGNFYPTVPFHLNGDAIVTRLGFATAPLNSARLFLLFPNTENGAIVRPTASGVASAMAFQNYAATPVGSIATNDSSTAYNTTSDARLKKDPTPLTGALDVVRRLRPITHLWRVDDSRGYGFLASEVQEIPEVSHAVTGEPDAINDDGSLRPQQMDYSKLVPHLTAALKDALAMIEALTARVSVLENAAP